MKVWRYAWAGSAAPKTVSAMRPASLAFNVVCMRASCRLTHLPVLGHSLSVSQQSGQARQLAYSAPLLGKPSACSYLAAVPPGTASLRLIGSDSQSLSGVQEAAVRIRSRLLGQRVSAPLRYGPHPAPVAPHRRCCLVPQFDGRCLFASTVLPRPAVSAALTR